MENEFTLKEVQATELKFGDVVEDEFGGVFMVVRADVELNELDLKSLSDWFPFTMNTTWYKRIY